MNKHVAIVIYQAPPDDTTNALLLMDSALVFRDKGWQVTIHAQSPLKATDTTTRDAEHKHIKIVHYHAPFRTARSIPLRMINGAVLAIQMFSRLLLFPKAPDIVLADTSSPLLGGVAWLLNVLRRIPYVYLVTELYPGVAVTLGALTPNGLPCKIWDLLNRKVIGCAAAVMTLGDRMKEELIHYQTKGTSPNQITVTPNWANSKRVGQVIIRSDDSNSFVEQYDLADKLVIMYAGNIGLSHDLPTILNVAESLYCEGNTHIKFIFVGGGARRNELHQRISECSLRNTLLLPRQPIEKLPEMYAAGDFAVISLAKGLTGFLHPSRVYPAMLARQAIIAITDTNHDIAEMVREHKVGITVAPGEAQELHQKIIHLSQGQGEVEEMRTRAQELAAQKFSENSSPIKYEQIVRKALLTKKG